jgi:hypothetical protein
MKNVATLMHDVALLGLVVALLVALTKLMNITKHKCVLVLTSRAPALAIAHNKGHK